MLDNGEFKAADISRLMSQNAKKRWEKTTPEERSAYAKKMVAAREEKRRNNKA